MYNVYVARSPVYSHFSTTLQGLSTIRTLGKQEEAQKLFHKYQNQQTQVRLSSCIHFMYAALRGILQLYVNNNVFVYGDFPYERVSGYCK